MGLSPESLGPALLEALHAVVPSLHNRIVWCDANRVLTGLYAEDPEMFVLGKRFFTEFDNRLQDFPGTRFLLTRRPGVGHYLPVVTRAAYFKSLYHNEIERPVGGHHFLDVVIGDAQGNVGGILLSRGARSKPFDRRELARLTELIPFMAHGFRARVAKGTDVTSLDGRTSTLVATLDGRLSHTTSTGQQWLSMAFFQEVTRGQLVPTLTRGLPDALRALCGRVSDLQRGSEAPPPNLVVRNAWGRFRFSAALMKANGVGQEPLVAITVEHWEPRAVTLMRNMWRLGLSPAQKRLCLVLMNGNLTEREAATALGVSPTTVRDHLDKIYLRLDLHSRDQLASTLLTPQPGYARPDDH